MTDIVNIIEWEDIFDDGQFPLYTYRFGPWWMWEDGQLICGMAHTLPSKKSLDYKPPRGLMRKLTIPQYEALTGAEVK
jgi:hypothetical protein